MKRASNTPEQQERPGTYTMQRWHRYWGVIDPAGELVCVAVYKRGAKEVIRRLCVAEEGAET